MHFLRKISPIRQNYLKMRRAIGQYWLDQLATQYGGVVISGKIRLEPNITAILRNEFGAAELIIPGANIVTNDGDVYYAQSAGGETPTDDFDAGTSGLTLGTGTTAVDKTDTGLTAFATGTGSPLEATYPKTNDGDADNTGAGTDVLTWTYAYTTAEANVGSIAEGGIGDALDGSTTALLTHFLFGAPFSKTSSDTLKVIVNATFTGT